MLARGLRLIAVGLLGACLSGCGLGLIYTHITVPLDLNVEDTPVPPNDGGDSDWKTLQYFVIRFDWNSAAIVDAAHAAGLTTIYYADMEILSVFFGLWEQRTAIVYGTGP